MKATRITNAHEHLGAGKSTIIKMLIERQNKPAHDDNRVKFPSPVTSSTNDLIPTTGDVHLYADPVSHYTKVPIMYADCEGLDGGEATPRGLRAKTKSGDLNPMPDITATLREISLPSRTPRPSSYKQSSPATTEKTSRKIRKSRHGTQRDIAWAVTPETKKREYAVTHLYPRLLYTFSDVVVFVLRNPR